MLRKPLNMKDSLVQVTAERVFKQKVKELVLPVPIPAFVTLASTNTTFEEICREANLPMGQQFKANAGTDYLFSLLLEEQISLIAQVAPDHAYVLQQYPQFAQSLLEGLKSLVTD